MQAYAGTPAPFNFNGLVRHYYLREAPELGELQVNLAPRGERNRASHAIALDLRERLKALEAARRHRHQGRRGAARTAGAGDPAGRDLRPRLGDPARRPRRSEEDLRLRAVHRRCRQLDRRAAAAAAAFDRSGSAGILRRRAEAMSTTRSRRCSAASRSAIRIAARIAIRSRSLSACRRAISPGPRRWPPRRFPPIPCRAARRWSSSARWSAGNQGGRARRRSSAATAASPTW